MKILFAMRDDGDMTEPMNVMLLSSLAKGAGHSTHLMVVERDGIHDTLKRVRPDVVAFSCITGSHQYYLSVAQQMKALEPRLLTVFGGPHFSFFPDEILRNDFVDAVCVGEGDNAWPELLSTIENHRSFDNIPNIVTQNNAGTIQSIRPRRVELDSLPFMDRGLVYNNTEFKFRFKRTHMASRGCPFKCTYCFEHQWNQMYRGIGTGKSARIRQWYSVDRFLDELEFVKKNWDTRFLKFYDDVMIPFPNDEEIAWHQEFCAKYPTRIGLPFFLLTRCDLVLQLMRRGVDVIADWKKAGLAALTMSIESGNPFIRDHVIVRDMTGLQIKDAFKMAWDRGVQTFPNTILGIPAPLLPHPDDREFDGKIERLRGEVKLLEKLNCRNVNVEQIITTARQTSATEAGYRLRLVELLTAVGFRHTYATYDRESVEFTLNQNPGFAEFPILAPYPKTKATDWCQARGDFDGNYEKLHASYQHRSVLTCYSEEEKAFQQNLALLGTFMTLFTGSRSTVIRKIKPLVWQICLIAAHSQRPIATKFYGWLYAVTQAYLHRSRIYPMHHTMREKIRFYRQMFSLIFWKQFQRKKRYRSQRPGQTLGGSASV